MPMCNKCDQIHNEIEPFRGLISPAWTPLSLAMIRYAIKMLEGEAAAAKCHDSQPN